MHLRMIIWTKFGCLFWFSPVKSNPNPNPIMAGPWTQVRVKPSLTVARILRCSVSPNVVNWLSFWRSFPSGLLGLKIFIHLAKTTYPRIDSGIFSRVLEYFETLEFYLENSNIYNRSLLTQIVCDFNLFARSACYRLDLDIHIKYLNRENKLVFLISLMKWSNEKILKSGITVAPDA